MLAIRLQRIGKKKQPTYRVVVSDKKKDLYGKHLEILGNYNPVSIPKTISLNADRIKYWLSQGAQASATVHNLLVREKVIEAKKVQAWKPKPAKGGSASGRKDEAQPKADQPLADAPAA